MLESALESLLLQVLAPYVEGVTRDKLHVGIFRGCIELRDLIVKPDALAQLGLEEFRVRSGRIALLRLAIPWTKLHAGKLRCKVEALHLLVEHVAEKWSPEHRADELVEEIRQTKRNAIDFRVSQLQDLLEQQRREQSQEKGMGGVASKLLRKIVNNLQVDLSGARVDYVSRRHAFAWSAELPRLLVLSTDQTFKERKDEEEVVVSGASTYKLLRIQGLAISVSRASPEGRQRKDSVVSRAKSSDEETARAAPPPEEERVAAADRQAQSSSGTDEDMFFDDSDYVLCPMNATIKLAHVPNDQILRMKLEVATKEIAELSLRRSQWANLQRAYDASCEEDARLREAMVPPLVEGAILRDAAGSRAEYRQLYERHLLQAKGASSKRHKALQDEDVRRMQCLEDVLSIRVLARERWKVKSKLEEAEREMNRRVQDIQRAKTEEKQRRTGMLKRVADAAMSAPMDLLATKADKLAVSPPKEKIAGSRGAVVWSAGPETDERNITEEEEAALLESVDLPQRLKFELHLGKVALDLVDDRWQEGAKRQLLSLGLQDAGFGVDVDFSDHGGQDLTEFRVECCVSTFRAIHAGRIVLRFCPPSLGPAEAAAAAAAEAPPDEGKADGPGKSLLLDYEAGATRFVIASVLEDGQNLLRLQVRFAPIELYFLPGTLDQLWSFFEAPTPARSGALHLPHCSDDDGGELEGRVALSAVGAAAAAAAAVADIDTASAAPSDYRSEADTEALEDDLIDDIGARATEFVELVTEQMPEKFHLDLRIDSPVLHVPLDTKGSSTFSFGQLHLHTLEPCEYSRMKFDIRLTNITIGAASSSGERFNVLQPLPMHIQLQYDSGEKESAVGLELHLATASLTLSPQSALLLMCAPEAINAALAFSAAADADVEHEEDDALDTASSYAPSRSSSKETSGGPPNGNRQPSSQTSAEVHRWKTNVIARVDALDIILVDSIVPVAKMRVDMPKTGLSYFSQTQPDATSLDLQRLTFEAELFDQHKGVWEPFVERFFAGVQLSMVQTSGSGDKSSAATHTLLSGYSPLLLNLTPASIQTMTLQAEHWSAVFEAPAADDTDSVDCQSRAGSAKFSAVNLCDHPLELEFLSSHRKGLLKIVKPTGSRPDSLDDWVLPNFATAVKVRVPGSTQPFSEPLQLERAGLAPVAIPECAAVAELLAPVAGRRLLLLATSLRLHNQTDLPLLVRFHDPVQQEVLMVDLQSTALCDASLLRPRSLPSEMTGIGEDTSPTGNWIAKAHGQRPSASPDASPSSLGTDSPNAGYELLLPPNALCAVPALALLKSRSSAGGSAPRVFASFKPALPKMHFCQPLAVGGRMGASFVRCCSEPAALSGTSQSGGDRGGAERGRLASELEDVNLLITCESPHATGQSSTQTTVAIRPSLVLLNALPTADIHVSCAKQGDSHAPRLSWTEAVVKRSSRLNLYSFPGVDAEGICLRAHMLSPDTQEPPQLNVGSSTVGGPPWSRLIQLAQQAFDEGSQDTELHGCGSGSSVRLQMRFNAAAAACTVDVDPLRLCEVRFSCPHWFVDRSGLQKPLWLQVSRDGRPLPEVDGLTLLPADCVETACTLTLQSVGKASDSKPLRMPPNWDVLPWRSACGNFVFCLQTEDVTTRHVFGARCRITTLRPRLVLMNSSPCNALELKMQNRMLRLGPEQCLEIHWLVPLSEEEAPTTSLRFRSLSNEACDWSGVTVCGDAAAGTTPFLLREAVVGSGRPSDASENGARAKRDYQVWSVDVAPERGALAVTFREGSDFVALNKAVKARLAMTVRPRSRASTGGGSGGSSAHGGPATCIRVMPGDPEAPYGWPELCYGERDRTVEVFVGGSWHRIDDVRQSMRRVLNMFKVALVVARVGSKTILSLEDVDPKLGEGSALERPQAEEAEKPNSSAWTTTVEVKLPQIGISLIGGPPQPAELLFLRVDLVRIDWRHNDADTQEIRFAASEFQVDCQLPGRVDARSREPQPHRHGRPEVMMHAHKERPAVILANCGRGDRAFLNLFIRRGATSSPDLLLQHLDFSMDALDVTIDDGWIEPTARFLAAATRTKEGTAAENGKSEAGCVSLRSVLAFAGRPIAEGYRSPPLPALVQVDSMRVSAVHLTLWCSLPLRSVGFLPEYVLATIRVLSMSGQLTLDAASIDLPPRQLPPHRGSLSDFAQGLASEYTSALLKNMGVVLGKSSVLNVPRVPLHLGGVAVSYMTDSISIVAEEAASLFSHLTFDAEYVAQQRRLRSVKQIHSVSDGVVEAGKSLAQGVEGLMDVVLKPSEGAQKGVGGLLKGVGKGLAGGLMKPITQFGQAISDVGAGVAEQLALESVSNRRRRARVRHRCPRPLFSRCLAVRRWSHEEAAMLAQLGSELLRGIEEIIPLTTLPPEVGQPRPFLLLYRDHFVVADVDVTVALDQTAGGSSSSSAPSGKGKASHPRQVRIPHRPIMRQDCRLDELQDIQVFMDDDAEEGPGLLQLSDVQGAVVSLPLFAAPLGASSRRALLAGFRAAMGYSDEGASSPSSQSRGSSKSVASSVSSAAACLTSPRAGARRPRANWRELRAALEAERRTELQKRLRNDLFGHEEKDEEAPRWWPSDLTAFASAQHADAGVLSGTGQRRLEVTEVERRLLGTSDWTTPFLPTDGWLAWRWVDARGRRHPHLEQGLRREQAAAMAVPPCQLDPPFVAASEWSVRCDPGCDADGWRYGVAWNASTWDSKPGRLDSLRRRRWTKVYT
eukprot:TRINITY_DN10044_c0_g1_i2.p1 TRINITY_DN10044_c0_g1~~TRINITY_DN10044_c0_g1_i2.p1  ORF type:complete len:2722 (-),score=650.48 TRINITY_DN10044_c0_g1_i2:259-8424(-)